MKNLTHLLFVLLCICLPVAVHAQKDKDKDDDDSKYLAGAVPEVDGKVVFTKEFSIPGTVSGRDLQPHAEMDGSTAEKE